MVTRLKNGYFVWNTVEYDDDGLPLRLFTHVHPSYPLLDQISYEISYLIAFFMAQGVDFWVLQDMVGIDLDHFSMDLSNMNLEDIARYIEALMVQEKLILSCGIPIKPVEFINGWESVEHPIDYIQHLRGTCENCFYCNNKDLAP